jgi:ABC-2 type transport system ATP-binding protein
MSSATMTRPDRLDDPDVVPVLDVRDLRMRYGQRDVLDGVSFHARRGEVLALLGPNGAGKSTTIEILEGFRIRSAGHVTVLGVDPAHATEAWRARIGVVLQSWRDHGKWRVRELLAHFGDYYRAYSSATRPRPWDTDELIAAVGLTEHARQRVARLSGGQRRRLDVAIGIVGRPELLFLDEPTAGFDPQARRDFHDLVHRLADIDDTTILLTTHDLDEAEKLADRILVLAGGTIIADGSAEQLSRRISPVAEVRWNIDGERFVHPTSDATAFVRALLGQHGAELTDLEIRRATLEDTYMTLVREFEAGRAEAAVAVGSALRADTSEPVAGRPWAAIPQPAQGPDSAADALDHSGGAGGGTESTGEPR